MTTAIKSIAFLILFTSQLPAAIVLQVDVSDPSAVVFTATGNTASASSSGYTNGEGVNLISFFTGNMSSTNAPALASSLTLGGLSLDSYYMGSYVYSATNLNLFSSSATGNVAITAGDVPFSGSLVFDLSPFSGFLPSAGSSGDIQGGDSLPIGSVFGQWEVVGASVIPEPSTYLAIISTVGLVGFVGYRRRKASKAQPAA